MFGADPTHVSVNFPYKPFLSAGAMIHELFMKSPVVILQLCFSLKLLHTMSTDEYAGFLRAVIEGQVFSPQG